MLGVGFLGGEHSLSGYGHFMNYCVRGLLSQKILCPRAFCKQTLSVRYLMACSALLADLSN